MEEVTFELKQERQDPSLLVVKEKPHVGHRGRCESKEYLSINDEHCLEGRAK